MTFSPPSPSCLLKLPVVLQKTARTCSSERAARAARLFFHTRPIKFLIYGVVVAVPVVDAKTPYLYPKGNTALN